MPLASHPDNIILGKGELFFDRHDPLNSYARTGYFHLGNCARFAILLNDDVLSLNTSQDQSGGLLKRVTRSREVEVQINSHEYAVENLALALMGDSFTKVQTSSAITGEVLTSSLVRGRFYRTSGRQINSPVVTNISGTATSTLVLNTDYTLYDARAGIIQLKQTSTATAGSLVIAYTRTALSELAIKGATKTYIQGSLLFMPDPTTGPQYDVEVFKCSVTPGGEVGLIGDEFGEYTLALAALSDAGGQYGGASDNPYFQKINREAVV